MEGVLILTIEQIQYICEGLLWVHKTGFALLLLLLNLHCSMRKLQGESF